MSSRWGVGVLTACGLYTYIKAGLALDSYSRADAQTGRITHQRHANVQNSVKLFATLEGVSIQSHLPSLVKVLEM